MNRYDVIVAGGGISGLLAAARIVINQPKRILILEKEGELGGRLRGSSDGQGYGLNAISDDLFNFCNQTLKTNPHSQDLSELVETRQETLGVLAGSEIKNRPIKDWFDPKGGPRLLGGYTASKQWPTLMDALAEAKPDAPFNQIWKLQKKSPATVVLDHFAYAFGIPDFWNASPKALRDRAKLQSGNLHCGDWTPVIEALTQLPQFLEHVDVKTNGLILKAERNVSENETAWNLKTEAGEFSTPKLIVAQSPWQAQVWLPRNEWPPKVLSIANKTRPVSAVILRETINTENPELPDVTLVPAEKCQIINNHSGTLFFQATIDYELSLQAPDVLKAIRRLKRARKKLLGVYPELCSQADRIALLPVAWAASPLGRDQKWIDRLDERSLHNDSLAFCGDAYGGSYDGDENIIASLLAIPDTTIEPSNDADDIITGAVATDHDADSNDSISEDAEFNVQIPADTVATDHDADSNDPISEDAESNVQIPADTIATEVSTDSATN